MLDLLMAIIEELTGEKKRPQSQPRRRMRDGASSGETERTGRPQSRQPAAPPPPPQEQRQPSYDDMVKEFFGMADEDEEEAHVEAAPPPPPPPSRQRSKTKAAQSYRPPPPTVYAPIEAAPMQTLTGTLGRRAEEEAPAALETASASAGASFSGKEVASRLRNNPNAAREAFVYSEIFGPPLADR